MAFAGFRSLSRMQAMSRSVHAAARASLAATAAAVATPALPAATPVAANAPAVHSASPEGAQTASVHIGSIQVVAPSGVSAPEALVDLLVQELGARLQATLAASFSD